MQQGGGGSQSHYGVSSTDMSTSGAGGGGGGGESTEQAQVVEAASPISSRPPANLDEFMGLSGEGDRGGGGGASGGNRWPRQETLALLKIRSDMDAAFRDATLKGPLWEDVSRKLAELGYKRSAKKCKEKFENVHKYYKRTKEGRAGRQDGKTYKFFSELEALHTPSASANQGLPPAAAVSLGGSVAISNPMPISSFRVSPSSHVLPPTPTPTTMPTTVFPTKQSLPPGATATPTPPPPPATTSAVPHVAISYSSNSSSSSPSSEDDADDEAGEPSNVVGSSRKRKRSDSSSKWAGSSSSHTSMMEFFENLMKQVMHKQEAMQQRFLEVIEKREQDRMIREEAWKRQEMSRVTREQELMAQERAISASRDDAIISFLQKITGQTIQLPPPLNNNNIIINSGTTNMAAAAAVVQQPPPPPAVAAAVPPPPVSHQEHVQVVIQAAGQPQISTSAGGRGGFQPSKSTQVLIAVPEQQVPPQDHQFSGGAGSSSFEPSSSRWPKSEVLALIKLRSGLESRYLEAGPKGPLWEEISTGMQRMGYKRSAKRCKEKWENINKYFKKVKESHKKRPEDAKTCPYFHELDALYRKKIIGTSGGNGDSTASATNLYGAEQPNTILDSALGLQPQAQENIQPPSSAVPIEAENKSAHVLVLEETTTFLGDGTGGGGGPSKKPEDIVKELMEEQEKCERQAVGGHAQQQLIVDDYDRIEELDSDNNIDDQEEEENDDDDDDNNVEDEDVQQRVQINDQRNMAYKIQLQRQTGAGASNGNEAAASFLAMVQ